MTKQKLLVYTCHLYIYIFINQMYTKYTMNTYNFHQQNNNLHEKQNTKIRK